MLYAIAFPKISCLYLSKFVLAGSIYSLESSGISEYSEAVDDYVSSFSIFFSVTVIQI